MKALTATLVRGGAKVIVVSIPAVMEPTVTLALADVSPILSKFVRIPTPILIVGRPGRGPLCNVHSCIGVDCLNGICIGPRCSHRSDHYGGGCVGNGCPAGGGGDGGDESCTTKKTASTCITTTTSSIFKPATTWTTWSFSECQTNIGCSVTDYSSSTTVTGTIAFPTLLPVMTDYLDHTHLGLPMNMTRLSAINPGDPPFPVTTVLPPDTTDPPPTAPDPTFVSCKHYNQLPGAGITQPYCECSSSKFPELVATQVTPHESCAYTVMPTITLGGDINQLPKSTDTAACSVCSTWSGNNVGCDPLPNCTPKPPTDLCLVLWGTAYIGGSSDNYGIYKAGEACSKDKSISIGSLSTPSACSLGNGDGESFVLCGKKAKLVHAGPVLKNVETGISCALSLQIDGLSYPGELPEGDKKDSKPCGQPSCTTGGIAFGVGFVSVVFKNVPICK